jgi:putative peptidoglycan lipid II flippase
VGPRLLTMLFIQFMFIARDNLASRLDQEGAVTALTYGWMIMQFPETVLGTAIATALLPTISEHATRQNWDLFHQTIEKALRILIALTLPVAAVMAAGINPLIRFVFRSLNESEVFLLTTTTRIYLITLCGYCIHEVAVRAFYARKEAWYPFAGVLIRLVIYLAIGIGALTLFRHIGAPAIAIAEIALLIEAIILLVLLSRRTHESIHVTGAAIRGIVAALLGGIVTYLVAWKMPGSAVLTALIGMIAGAAVALVIIWSEVKLLLKL